jgi:CBS domain-containing protein
MICPNCGYDNLPGSEECGRCLQDLTQLDRPMANNRVERSLMEDPVSLLNPRVPVTLSANATLREAIATLLGRDIGALIVADAQQKLLGIFSERDLLKKVAGVSEASLDKPIGSFMTAKPETVSSTDTLAFALHKMDVGGYRHLPVLCGDRVVGVISVRDMLRHITHLCR